jgi:hypothetical protein
VIIHKHVFYENKKKWFISVWSISHVAPEETIGTLSDAIYGGRAWFVNNLIHTFTPICDGVSINSLFPLLSFESRQTKWTNFQALRTHFNNFQLPAFTGFHVWHANALAYRSALWKCKELRFCFFNLNWTRKDFPPDATCDVMNDEITERDSISDKKAERC